MQRFWAKVRVTRDWESCWEWIGYTNAGGYGVTVIGTKANPRSILTHRLAYALSHGEAPSGALILHSCDNRPCVRPSHLSAGSNVDNMREMVERGRSSSRPGEANPRAKLTGEQVMEMRETYAGLRRGEKTEYRNKMAEKYGVSFAAIRAAIYGESWKNDDWVSAVGADAVKERLGI